VQRHVRREVLVHIAVVESAVFKMMAGVNMIHVPYRGGAPAMTDLMGGQVQVCSTPYPSRWRSSKQATSAAVTTATRSEVLPDVPTVAETLPGYEASAVQGIGAPKKTPAEVIDKLNTEINAGLADPRIKARFADLGGTVLPVPPPTSGKIFLCTSRSTFTAPPLTEILSRVTPCVTPREFR
jgi:hypothetical protein